MGTETRPAEEASAIWTIPDPPNDSCFVLDKDDQGNSRLSWNLHEGPARDFAKVFVGFWLTLWILAGLAVLVAFVFANMNWSERIGVFFWLLGWAGVSYLVRKFLFRYLIDPNPETLTFTDTALKYDPAFSNLYRIILRKDIFPARKTEIPRQAIREIRWQPGSTTYSWRKPMRFLKIRHGYDQLEVGPSLNNSDAEWLGQVLKDWSQKKASLTPHAGRHQQRN
jgi:hypothetical protein